MQGRSEGWIEYSAQLDSKLIYCEKKKHTLTPNQSGRTAPLSDMTLKQFQKNVRLWSCITLSGHLKLQRDRHTAERVRECSTDKDFSDRSPLNMADMERIRYLVFPLDCLGLCRLCPCPSDSVSVIVWLSLQLDTNQQQKPFVSALDIWNTRARTLSLTMAFNPLIPFQQ